MDPTLDDHYAACLDSVAVINQLASSSSLDDQATIGRNIEHLELMLTREKWEERHDLKPLMIAIEPGRSVNFKHLAD